MMICCFGRLVQLILQNIMRRPDHLVSVRFHGIGFRFLLFVKAMRIKVFVLIQELLLLIQQVHVIIRIVDAADLGIGCKVHVRPLFMHQVDAHGIRFERDPQVAQQSR